MSLWYEFIALEIPNIYTLPFHTEAILVTSMSWPPHSPFSPEWILILSGIQAYNKVNCESMLLTSSPAISRSFQVWVLRLAG